MSFAARFASQPPSSPTSEASSWPNSSDIGSSPARDASSDDENDDFLPSRVVDPLAGSYNAKRAKRDATELSRPPSPSKKKARRGSWTVDLTDEPEDAQPGHTENGDSEDSVWDDLLEAAFSGGVRTINISNIGITYIPPKVMLDLSKMVVLPERKEATDDVGVGTAAPSGTKRTFTRIQTAPASTSLPWGMAPTRFKTLSSNAVLGCGNEEHVEMYLYNNAITKLPTELFSMVNLRVLSLRGNKISYIPPEIGKLVNLVDLNIAQNMLTFLPSELLTMPSLTKLVVFPNGSFIPKPTNQSISNTKIIGSRVPWLSELCLRVLLSPDPDPDADAGTLLESRFALPITNAPPFRPMSIPLQRVLAKCVPGSITNEQQMALPSSQGGQDDPQECNRVTGIGWCPNRAHGSIPSVFVQHVAERFTWVDKIAGQVMGGYAPIRWRGCEAGCLAFLGPEPEESDEEEQADEAEEDEMDVVQAIELEDGELDFD